MEEPLAKGEMEVPGEALCVALGKEDALSVLVAVAPTALPLPCAVACAELVEESVSWLLWEGVGVPPALPLELLLGAAVGEAETLREGEEEEEALAVEVRGVLGDALELAVVMAEALSCSEAVSSGVAVAEAVKVSLPLAAAETEAEGVAREDWEASEDAEGDGVAVAVALSPRLALASAEEVGDRDSAEEPEGVKVSCGVALPVAQALGVEGGLLVREGEPEALPVPASTVVEAAGEGEAAPLLLAPALPLGVPVSKPVSVCMGEALAEPVTLPLPAPGVEDCEGEEERDTLTELHAVPPPPGVGVGRALAEELGVALRDLAELMEPAGEGDSEAVWLREAVTEAEPQGVGEGGGVRVPPGLPVPPPPPQTEEGLALGVLPMPSVEGVGESVAAPGVSVGGRDALEDGLGGALPVPCWLRVLEGEGRGVAVGDAVPRAVAVGGGVAVAAAEAVPGRVGEGLAEAVCVAAGVVVGSGGEPEAVLEGAALAVGREEAVVVAVALRVPRALNDVQGEGVAEAHWLARAVALALPLPPPGLPLARAEGDGVGLAVSVGCRDALPLVDRESVTVGVSVAHADAVPRALAEKVPVEQAELVLVLQAVTGAEPLARAVTVALAKAVAVPLPPAPPLSVALGVGEGASVGDALPLPVPMPVRELLSVPVEGAVPVPPSPPELPLAMPLEDCSRESVDTGVPVPTTLALPETEALAPREALTLRLALAGEAVGAVETAALPVSVPGRNAVGEGVAQGVGLGVSVLTPPMLPEAEYVLCREEEGVAVPKPCAAVPLPAALGVGSSVGADDPEATAVAVSHVCEALWVPVGQARGVVEADTQSDAAPLGVAVPCRDLVPPRAPAPAVSEAVAVGETVPAALALPLRVCRGEGLGVHGAEAEGEGVRVGEMDCSAEGVVGGEGVPAEEGEVDCVGAVLPVLVRLVPAERVCEAHMLMLGVLVGQPCALWLGVPEAVPCRVALELWQREKSGEGVGGVVEEALCDTVAEAQGVGLPPVLLAVPAALREGVPLPVPLVLPRVVGLMDTDAGGLLLALPPVALAERAVPCGVAVPLADALARGVALDALPSDALTDKEALRDGARDGVDGRERLAERHADTEAVEQGVAAGVAAPLAVPCSSGEVVGYTPLPVAHALCVKMLGEAEGVALPAAEALPSPLALAAAPVPLRAAEAVAWPARDGVTLRDKAEDAVEVGEASAVRELLPEGASGVPERGGVALPVESAVLLSTRVAVTGLEGVGPAGVDVAVKSAGEGEGVTEGVEHCVHAEEMERAALRDGDCELSEEREAAAEGVKRELGVLPSSPPLLVGQGEAVPVAGRGVGLCVALVTELSVPEAVVLALPLPLPPTPPAAARLAVLGGLDVRDTRGDDEAYAVALDTVVSEAPGEALTQAREVAVASALEALPLGVPTPLDPLAAADCVAAALGVMVTEGDPERVLPPTAPTRDCEGKGVAVREGTGDAVARTLPVPAPSPSPVALEKEEVVGDCVVAGEAEGVREPPATPPTPPSALGDSVGLRVDLPPPPPPASRDGVGAGDSVALAVLLAPSKRDWVEDCVGVGVAPALALKDAVVVGESVAVAVP